MNNLNSALIEIEGEIANARHAKDQLELEIVSDGRGGGELELPQDSFEVSMARAEQLLEVVLEAAQLPETRARLIKQWGHFEKAGIGKTKFYPEVDYLESKPLEYLQNAIRSVRLARGEQNTSWESYELKKFEAILRNTAVLLHRRRIIPKSEADIRAVMHDYLGAVFTEYTRSIQIAGIIRSFKPDGGVRNLKAAIEFKFAATREEVSGALGGIFEDVSGYSASSDWVRFYSVVFQTAPFEAEDRFQAELKRAGALTWTPILVTGGGSRRKKRASKKTPRT